MYDWLLGRGAVEGQVPKASLFVPISGEDNGVAVIDTNFVAIEGNAVSHRVAMAMRE